MKTLKFNHATASLVQGGQKTTTWRLFDDKDISVNDLIKIIDKVDPNNPQSWQVIGEGAVNQIVEMKLQDISPTDMKGEGFSSQSEMLVVYRNYYGNRVEMDTPVKIIHFEFQPHLGEMPSKAMLLEEAKVYTDGGSRGNPGDSACAFVICKMDDTVVEKSGIYMGMATNNQAEYYGMIKGLERARDLGIDKIALFSDSQLVVNQMNGFYKVKNQELAPLHQQLKELASSFSNVSFTHIPRELNRESDKEVNRILDHATRQRHSKS
jgi:ribonuclease HI